MKPSLRFGAAILLAVCHSSGAFVSPNHRAPTTAAGVNSKSIHPGQTSAWIKPSLFLKKPTSALSLASKKSDDTSEPSWSFNPLFASLWIGFFAFAAFGPGEIGAASDTKMITDYIADPTNPGFSEGFQLIFNYLGIMPMIIACTAVPQAAQRGLPPLPFLVSSFAMGYGGVGPYLSFRAPPKGEYNPAEASWFTRNVLESKLLGWGLVAGVVGLPFVVGLVDALAQDPAGTIQGYKDLFATSKFVSASSVDAIVLNVAAASLIPQDMKLRQPDIEDSKAKLIGASTLLVPFLGAALYCALRPALPQKNE